MRCQKLHDFQVTSEFQGLEGQIGLDRTTRDGSHGTSGLSDSNE